MSYLWLFLALNVAWFLIQIPSLFEARLRTIRDGTGSHRVSLAPIIPIFPSVFTLVAFAFDFFWPDRGTFAVLSIHAAFLLAAFIGTVILWVRIRHVEKSKATP